MNNIEELRALVDKVFEDEADYDEVFALLGERIAVEPASVPLLELRLRLLEAAYDQAGAWADMRRLAELKPEDLDLHLGTLRMQARWSGLIAESQHAEQFSAAGADRLEEADEEESEAIQSSPEFLAVQERVEQRDAALKAQAVAQYLDLMRERGQELPDARKIVQSWDEAMLWATWPAYVMAQEALRGHPREFEFLKREALCLAGLADQVDGDGTKVAIGYFVDPIHGQIHARTAYDALEAIEKISGMEADRELQEARARLQEILGNYAAAAQSHRLLARACEAALAGADEDESESLRMQMEGALKSAGNCDLGREAVHASYFASMDDALETAEANMLEMNRKLEERLGRAQTVPVQLDDTRAALRDWRQNSATAKPGPTEEEQANLRTKAAQTAASIAGLVRFTPAVLSPMTREDFKTELSPWFDEIEPVLRGNGLQLLGWFQNLQNVEALKTEAPGQLWISPERDFILTAEATPRIRLKRCMSELSDGSLLLTTDARGSGMFSSGPRVDAFGVFKSSSLADMLAVHRARLGAKLARNPGLSAVPIDTLARAEAVESRLKKLASEFRMAEGITEPEIRGMNVQHHDFFAAELKRAVAERLAALPRAG